MKVLLRFPFTRAFLVFHKGYLNIAWKRDLYSGYVWNFLLYDEEPVRCR